MAATVTVVYLCLLAWAFYSAPALLAEGQAISIANEKAKTRDFEAFQEAMRAKKDKEVRVNAAKWKAKRDSDVASKEEEIKRLSKEVDRLTAGIDEMRRTNVERRRRRDELLTLAGKLSQLQDRAVSIAQSIENIPIDIAFALSGLAAKYAEPNRAEKWWEEVLAAAKGTDYEGYFSEYYPMTTTGDSYPSAAKRIRHRTEKIGSVIRQIHEDARALI